MTWAWLITLKGQGLKESRPSPLSMTNCWFCASKHLSGVAHFYFLSQHITKNFVPIVSRHLPACCALFSFSKNTTMNQENYTLFLKRVTCDWICVKSSSSVWMSKSFPPTVVHCYWHTSHLLICSIHLEDTEGGDCVHRSGPGYQLHTVHGRLVSWTVTRKSQSVTDMCLFPPACGLCCTASEKYHPAFSKNNRVSSSLQLLFLLSSFHLHFTPLTIHPAFTLNPYSIYGICILYIYIVYIYPLL